MATKNKITQDQRIFLALVERSLKGREWASVSDALWNHTKTMQAQIPDLVEIDMDKQQVRPTDEGRIVIKWM